MPAHRDPLLFPDGLEKLPHLFAKYKAFFPNHEISFEDRQRLGVNLDGFYLMVGKRELELILVQREFVRVVLDQVGFSDLRNREREFDNG